MRKIVVALIFACTPVWAAVGGPSGTSAADTPFVQEYHEQYSLGVRRDENDVRSIAVAGNGDILAASKAGLYCLKAGGDAFDSVMNAAQQGPVFDLVVDASGEVWAAAWNGVYHWSGDRLEQAPHIDGPVAAIAADGGEIVAAGRAGIWTVHGETHRPLPCATSVRAILPDGAGGLWIATSIGLYHDRGHDGRLHGEEDGLTSCGLTSLAAMSDGTLWAGGLGGITVLRDGAVTRRIARQEGLPFLEVTSIVTGPDSTLWAGTRGGVVRFSDKTWSLRHGRRWLASDNVQDIVFDGVGNAWIATDAGVSVIRRKTMTLADKAGHFEDVTNARHVRAPGLVELCALEKPGVLSTWKPRDDDNDGQYTAMYLAMESYRYAATKDPEAREAARRAFGALAFLREVTGTPGFVARTVIPADWTAMADPNEEVSDQEWADRQIADPRDKRVNNRWRLSADGKWRWKGDTSSDEITGHFYAYPLYFDLAADEPEKERVRDHVRRVTDYIMDHGHTLVDIDGEPTRWGVWAPEKLNHDPDWQPERGINSVEILSYLKTAAHITGDEKYQTEYLRLLNDCGYAQNARRAKNYSVAWRTHIDDELLALAYTSLLRYETDPDILAIYRESIAHWYAGVREEGSPFFNFTYAMLTGGDPRLEDSLFFLRDMPLDLVNWTVDNSERADLRMVHEPELDKRQTDRLPPPSERGVMRWDRNPWRAVQGDGGHSEAAPTTWLLPYWMGRHCGYIN